MRRWSLARNERPPQNRVTGVGGAPRVAKAFGLDSLSTVTAIKSQIGTARHCGWRPIGGEPWRICIANRTWNRNRDISPRCYSQDGLDFVLKSRQQRITATLINAKGFGGNNATAASLSLEATATLKIATWRHPSRRVDEAQARQAQYRHKIDHGTIEILYHYGENIIEGSDLEIGPNPSTQSGFWQQHDLESG